MHYGMSSMSRKKRAKPTKRPKAASHARRATETFAAGEFAAAATHCRLALDVDSSADGIWHLLAASLLVLVPLTLVRALRGRFEAHKKIARITLPIWFYVSVTGVVVYVFLYV